LTLLRTAGDGTALERVSIDLDLAPLIASQRAAIARQRDDLDRLDEELTDLELTIWAAGRARATPQGDRDA
jgi:uncharacterized coiled-coil protein SlyX